jgi:hypothetical protein
MKAIPKEQELLQAGPRTRLIFRVDCFTLRRHEGECVSPHCIRSGPGKVRFERIFPNGGAFRRLDVDARLDQRLVAIAAHRAFIAWCGYVMASACDLCAPRGSNCRRDFQEVSSHVNL